MRMFDVENYINLVSRLARIFLFVIALFSLFIFWVWVEKAEWVNAIDVKIKANYVARYQNIYSRAIELLRNDNGSAEGIRLLAELEQKLKGIKSQDRLAELKQKVYLSLIEISLKSSKTDETIDLYNRWLIFDKKNVRAWIGMAGLLGRIEGRQEEALEILANWFQKLPEQEFIGKAFSTLLAEQGREFEAYGVIRSHLDQKIFSRNKRWQYFWSSTGEFSSRDRGWMQGPIFSGSELFVSVEWGNIGEWIRIDPASYGFSYRLMDPEFTLVTSAGKASYPLKDFPAKWMSAAMNWKGSVLNISIEDDPHFAWKIPKDRIGQISRINFTAKIDSTPLWILDVFSKSQMKSLIAEMEKIKDRKSSKFLKFILRRSTPII